MFITLRLLNSLTFKAQPFHNSLSKMKESMILLQFVFKSKRYDKIICFRRSSQCFHPGDIYAAIFLINVLPHGSFGASETKASQFGDWCEAKGIGVKK